MKGGIKKGDWIILPNFDRDRVSPGLPVDCVWWEESEEGGSNTIILLRKCEECTEEWGEYYINEEDSFTLYLSDDSE